MKYFKSRLVSTALVAFYYLCCARLANAGLLQPDISSGIKDETRKLGTEAGFNVSQTLGSTVAVVIEAFLSLLGIIFIILILYAGYNWMTADGDEQKITKAKDTIKRAIIGLIITFGAFAITYFVFTRLPGGTGGVGGPG